MKRIIYLLILLLCLPTLTNCSNNNMENIVEISPSTLFEGELKKIEPHLDLLTGCVEVSYKGNKKNFRAIYELWEKGKVTEEYDGISFKGIEDSFDSDISVSAKRLENDKYRLKLIVENAMTTEKFDLPINLNYNAINLNKQIKTQDDKEIIIWGLAGTKVNDGFISYSNIEKTLEVAEAALVLKIKFE
ncbi:hypothetical protein [Dethiothermospora halolimnae]|uniref:hypothetical protein n=1 Tax=Dethiothermospora halolimnae TaxID=3114390 RepID=UPI003CCBB53B